MTRAARPFLAPILALCLAWVAAWSAFHMAPDRATNDRIAAAFATGMTEADLCGDPAADHRCPFCHKLPDAAQPMAPGRAIAIRHGSPAPRGADLVLGPQHLHPHVSTRAPPRAA